MVSHYDWKSGRQRCGACGWTGLGGEAQIGEGFRDGAEYHCPACGERFGFVPYPQLCDSITDPRAPTSDKGFAEVALRHATPPTIPALARVIAHNETWVIFIRWLGFGRVEVAHLPSARHAVMSAALKSRFLRTMEALMALGVQMNAGDPRATSGMELFAKIALDPEALVARTILRATDREIAESIVRDEVQN